MKKFLIFLFVFLSVVFTAVASPAAINFDNLPKDEKFQALFLDFGNAFNAISYSDFNHKEEKKDALKAANDLYSYLKKKKKANYDERLLKLLAGRCLYNYDEVSFSDVEKDFNALEKYMEMKNYQINGFFIENYAYAQFMCDMPFNALYSITNGGRIPEESIQNQQLLGLIKNRIKESSSQEKYETNQVWKISQEEEGYNFVYSTMYGISFPGKGSWNLRYQQSEDGKPAMCIFGIDGFSLNERPAGISLVMMVYPSAIDSKTAKANLLKSFNIIKTENVLIDEKSFEKYTYEDLTKYADARQGSRGYIYAATIEPGKWSEARAEHAVDMSKFTGNSGSEGAKYYAITPSQNRLQEPLTVLILVDSCNALIEQTDQLLNELFSKAVFD